MKAARVLRFGSPNVITNDDLPQPEPIVELCSHSNISETHIRQIQQLIHKGD